MLFDDEEEVVPPYSPLIDLYIAASYLLAFVLLLPLCCYCCSGCIGYYA